MSWENISCWIEHHPGLASWAQALGAIIAIMVTASIAGAESRKLKKLEELKRLSAIETVICILGHVKFTIIKHSRMSNNDLKIFEFQADIIRVSAILDRIDFMCLPSPTVVQAVFAVRHELESILNRYHDISNAKLQGISFKNGTEKPALELINKQIEMCETAKQRH